MEPNNILDTFFSFQNPIIMVSIIFIVMGALFVLMKKEIIKPLQTKNSKLKALFAELDPDPILRIDSDGIIDNMNEPALEFFSEKYISQGCDKLIPNYKELKENSSNHNQVVLINGKHFTVSIKESIHLEFSLVYLHDITNRIEQEKIIREYQENLKLLRVKLEDLNEKEREHIGQELHDHIGNRISFFKMNLQSYIETPEGNGLSELYENIDFISEEVRQLSHQLSPKILKEFGLIPALTDLVDELTKNSNIQGEIKNINYEEEGSFKLKLGIYRICQEALSNIIKHSQCSEFGIQIVLDEDYLKVFISDNGIGCSMDKLKNRDKPSLGLLNMEERTESLNGKFEFDSIKGEGTTIFLEFNIESGKND